MAVPSTSFNVDHPETVLSREENIRESGRLPSEFLEDPLNQSAAGTAPPAGNYSPDRTTPTSPYVVIGHVGDPTLDQELRQEIDPTPVAASAAASAAPAPAALADAGPGRPPPLPGGGPPSEGEIHSAEVAARPAVRRLADLAGVWEGTFTFRGTVTGSFAGEVPVAVDGESVEVDDFCPTNGGTLTATASSGLVSWQGRLPCARSP